ncbi:MAG: STELLO glycosyltransferase family protein [Chryseolinea sp.]
MNSDKISIVVTSIFSPNKSMLALSEGAKSAGWDFIIVGDVSSPPGFRLDGAEYYDIHMQKKLDFKFSALCPERHYTRKNIGYLLAMASGSNVIVETDDDNIPNPLFWHPRMHAIDCYQVTGSGWLNVYRLFTDDKIWPRGFPLEAVLDEYGTVVDEVSSNHYCPVQQGLADGNPDVDAVFRMTKTLPFSFEKTGNFHVASGLWCPFNSQNTTWYGNVFPLLYLPSFCSFRMTDIWRSFVTQRILWQCGWGVLFHGPTVYQERNEHNLLKDFEQEVPGYLCNNRIKEILEGLTLRNGIAAIADNMLICYEALVKNGIISDERELTLLSAWLEDVKNIK